MLAKLFDKEPPTAPEAERAVLGAMMLDGRCVPVVMGMISGACDFHDQANAAIYEAIIGLHMAGNGTDPVSVKQVLVDRKLFDGIGGSDYLLTLVECVPSSASARHHAGIVADKARVRSVIKLAADMLDKAYNSTKSADELVASVADGVDNLRAKAAPVQAVPLPPCTAAQELWDATPAEIRRVYYSLKRPTDAGKCGILLSDPCKLLLAYAIVGTMASKKIVVSNAHMLSVVEHFYTNHFCFFINNSGDSKTGTTGIIQELVEQFAKNIHYKFLRPRLESGMASGPVIMIEDCFGTHEARIKARTVGTGCILEPSPGSRKDAEPRREITAQDVCEAREKYKQELWEARDGVRPIIFVVDELAEKLANIAKNQNGPLIDIHSSGPEVRTEGKYNEVKTCYGYGACVSIYGNMQKALAADLFYSPKNASSGLQGRCLPLSNDFQSDVILGDDSAYSQREVAKWLAAEFGPMPVNYIPARFQSFDDSALRKEEEGHHGIEFNKFHVMTQRLLAPLFVFGGPLVAQEAYGPCLRLLMRLFPHAFATGMAASAKAQERSSSGRTAAVVARKIKGVDSVRTRDIVMGFKTEERRGKHDEVNAQLSALGWIPIYQKNKPTEIVGWQRVK